MTNSSGDQTTNIPVASAVPNDIFEASESLPLNQPHLKGLIQPVTNPKVVTEQQKDIQGQNKSQGPGVNTAQNQKSDEVLSHNVTAKIETVINIAVDHAKEYKNVTVTLKPVPRGNFRLGLEKQPERFTAMPGSTFRYAPKVVGEMIRTGLNRPEMGTTPQERALRQQWLELQVGRPLDAKYYSEMSVVLDRNAQTGEKFKLWKAEDFIIYLTMLESDQIANGLHEYQTGKKPFAEFYIENKEAEAEFKAQSRNRSLTILQKFGEISDQKKRNIATMAGLEVIGLSPLATSNELWAWVEAEDKPGDAKTKELRQQLFLQWLEYGDTYINVSALVKNAVKYNILRKNGAQDYFYGNDLLGSVEEDVIKKLMSPAMGDVRKAMQDKVDAKIS